MKKFLFLSQRSRCALALHLPRRNPWHKDFDPAPAGTCRPHGRRLGRPQQLRPRLRRLPRSSQRHSRHGGNGITGTDHRSPTPVPTPCSRRTMGPLYGKTLTSATSAHRQRRQQLPVELPRLPALPPPG